MVEVFKTNVSNRDEANLLIAEIHERFPVYQATFDLADCDRILRVKCSMKDIHALHLIELLGNHGYRAEILEDTLPDGTAPQRKGIIINHVKR